MGFSRDDFAALAAVSQWATLRRDRGRDRRSALEHANTPQQGESVVSLTPGMLAVLWNTAHHANTSGLAGGAGVGCGEFGSIVDDQDRMLALSGPDFERSLNRLQKGQLGRSCKACLDVARGFGMLSAGFAEVQLIRYTRSSLENLLIVGKG